MEGDVRAEGSARRPQATWSDIFRSIVKGRPHLSLFSRQTELQKTSPPATEPMYHPTRGGTRGGAAEFSWDAVRQDKHREFYLGHSIQAPTGRWLHGRDVQWYNKDESKDEGEAADKRRQELLEVKRREMEEMDRRLGIQPGGADGDASTSSSSRTGGPAVGQALLAGSKGRAAAGASGPAAGTGANLAPIDPIMSKWNPAGLPAAGEQEQGALTKEERKAAKKLAKREVKEQRREERRKRRAEDGRHRHHRSRESDAEDDDEERERRRERRRRERRREEEEEYERRRKERRGRDGSEGADVARGEERSREKAHREDRDEERYRRRGSDERRERTRRHDDEDDAGDRRRSYRGRDDEERRARRRDDPDDPYSRRRGGDEDDYRSSRRRSRSPGRSLTPELKSRR